MKITIRQKAKEMHNKGITLIALVITIIVLLILAGISIAMLTGENGILTKGNQAKEQTRRQEIIENAKLAILEYEAENEGKITDDKAYEIIAKYDKNYKENEVFEFETNEEGKPYFTSKDGYEIFVKEVWESSKAHSNEIEFTLDGYKLTAIKGETWKEWYDREENKQLVLSIVMQEERNTAFTVLKNGMNDGYHLELMYRYSQEVIEIRKTGTFNVEYKSDIIVEGARYVQFLDGQELEESFKT